MTEEWRPVVGYEGYYEVSDLGRVRSARTESNTWRGRVLKNKSYSPKEYAVVALSVPGRRTKTAKVHLLVADAFMPPKPTPKHEINHRDSDRANPRLGNLEWVTRAENLQYAVRAGRWPDLRGENSPAAKLTEAVVAEIRAMRGVETQEATAERLGLGGSTVCQIQRGTRWGHSHDGSSVGRTGMHRRGSAHGRAVLTEGQVREILSLRGQASQRVIGERFGISQSHVSLIHQGKIWGHVQADGRSAISGGQR